MTKLYMLNRGDEFIWETGEIFTVDHHDALSTHAVDKDGATFLFYGPTDVLTLEEFRIQCIELADLIGDDESFHKYLEEYGGSTSDLPTDEYATASAWNALNKSEGL